MIIRTCPETLKTQKELVAQLVYAQNLPNEQRALTDGLLNWLQEIVDNYESFEQKSVELKFEVDRG